MEQFLVFYVFFSGFVTIGIVAEPTDHWTDKLVQAVVCVVFIGWWAFPLSIGDLIIDITTKIRDDKQKTP